MFFGVAVDLGKAFTQLGKVEEGLIYDSGFPGEGNTRGGGLNVRDFKPLGITTHTGNI